MKTQLVKQRMSVLAFAILWMLTVGGSQLAQSQTYNKIWDFTGGIDGDSPYAGLTIDKYGVMYGTTTASSSGYGTVFKLTGSGSNWNLTTLYSFGGAENHDGQYPMARLTVAADGSLYGTTAFGGNPNDCQFVPYGGCGTIFRLRSPGNVCLAGPGKCPWKETVIHEFSGIPDGALPMAEVTFDSKGNLYGTTATGGFQGGCYDQNGCGTVFKYEHSNSNWTLSETYSFIGFLGANGVGQPGSGVILDSAGNVYGTTACCWGPPGNNTIFKLVSSGTGWSESDIYAFQPQNDGDFPYGTLIADNTGNFYGTTSNHGANGGGTAFQFTTSGTFHTLASFSGYPNGQCGPWGGLVMDASSNLYGTTQCDGAYGWGSVFELKLVGGTYQYVSLYDFTGGTDGGYPYGALVMDSNGYLYGTASQGGNNRLGVVFRVKP